MGFFAGVDLGKRKSQITVLTADRKVVENVKIDNDAKRLEFPEVILKNHNRIEEIQSDHTPVTEFFSIV